MSQPIHIPVLRAGSPYRSLDLNTLSPYAGGDPLCEISQANAGMIRRDLRKIADKAKALREIPMAEWLKICKQAGQHFLHDTLPLNDEGATQSADEYVATLSSTSGLPHTLCRRNMQKVFTVFDGMEGILRGLTRGMDLSILDSGFGEQNGAKVCYGVDTPALGVVLPSNSPGVNSIWMPALALKVPVILKPGREEPWTPLRIIQAFLKAGAPKEAFSFYPTDHEGAAHILNMSGRALLFGDENTTKAYAHNPHINLHGPGRSKVLIGEDEVDNWREHLPVLVASVADNGGRSCINASSIFAPRHSAEIAEAVAKELAGITPRPADDPEARLSAFANPKFAEFIDAAIDQHLKEPGARDLTAQHRDCARHQIEGGAHFVLPTVIHCERVEHPLARSEYMFPFVAVTEVPQDKMLAEMGDSLVVTAITRDEALVEGLLASPQVDRLNLGPVPTSHVEWDQPHEGNLFEFLYRRRAIQKDW